MRLRIGKIVAVIMLTMCLGIQAAKAQVVASNPLEWMALAEGNELINKQVDKQIMGRPKQPFCKTPSLPSLTKYTNGKRSITAI